MYEVAQGPSIIVSIDERTFVSPGLDENLDWHASEHYTHRDHQSIRPFRVEKLTRLLKSSPARILVKRILEGFEVGKTLGGTRDNKGWIKYRLSIQKGTLPYDEMLPSGAQ